MYDPQRLHTAMAGSGQPYKVLTQQRLLILRALHDQQPLAVIMDTHELNREALEAELQPLMDASLLAKYKDDSTFIPQFFIADAAETHQVQMHAAPVGQALAQELIRSWDTLTEAYQRMSLGGGTPFLNHAFLLVGARILDIGLLDALASDGTLLMAAPRRPSPDHATANYYFMMIEGSPADAGRYGQNTIELPYAGWNFFSFGQYHIDEQRNLKRRDLDNSIGETAKRFESLETFANELKTPIFNRNDVAIWLPITQQLTTQLVTLYHGHEATIRALYSGLRASQYTPYGFGEFFCWYDHLAYAHAIDALEATGRISIPETRFAAALWEGVAGPAVFNASS